MKRREFMWALGALGLGAAGVGAWKYWPEQGFINPCLAGLPEAVAHHPLMRSVWAGLDPAQVWDSHVHLVGEGDAGNGAWFSPDMNSLEHPLLRLQKSFYMNAACVNEAPGKLDASYVARMLQQIESMPAGFKALLFAFDLFHDEAGNADRQRSIFYISNHYAAQVAHAHPTAFEWAASIHPYRADCVEALQLAVQQGREPSNGCPRPWGLIPSHHAATGFTKHWQGRICPSSAMPGASWRCWAGIRISAIHCACAGQWITVCG